MNRTTKVASLSSVSLNEISFVGKGDNKGAHILLLKRKDESVNKIAACPKDYNDEVGQEKLLKAWAKKNVPIILKDENCAQTFNEIIADKAIRDKVWQLVWTLEDSLGSILRDEAVADKAGMIQETIDQFKEAVTTITKEGGKEVMAKTDIEKAQEQVTTLTKQVEDLTKEKDTLVEENTGLKDQIEKAKEPDTDGNCKTCGAKVKKDDIDKSALPESVRKKLDEQETRIAKMEDERTTEVYLNKAKDVPNVGEVETVGDLLKKIAKHDPKTADAIYGILKTADNRIKEGELLKEKGKESSTGTTTAIDKLNKEAEEYAKANNVSKEKAFDHVYTNNHELRKEYLQEKNQK